MRRVGLTAERLLRWLLGLWLLQHSVGLALHGSSRLLVALGLFAGVAAVLFMRTNTVRWGAGLLLSCFTFAAGFHLRAGELPAPLLGYAAAVVALTLAAARRREAAGHPLSTADNTFLQAFTANRLAPADFHHREHIRAAWAMLRCYPFGEALGRYSAALRRLAQRAGKPEIYHETITWAYLLLIHERLQGPGGALPFAAFAAQNADLLARKPSVLESYYSPHELDSEQARRVFVLPRARPVVVSPPAPPPT